MDYEKKYKDLVKAVKELQEANPSDEGIQNWVKENVPELKESEDERIRKEMLEYCYKRMNNEFPSITIHQIERWLAWLEKQGQTFTKKDVDDAYLKGVCDTKHELEKQGEQTPVERPAFDIGETITDGNSTFKIANTEGDYYIADDGDKIPTYLAHRFYVPIQHFEMMKPAWSEEDEEEFRIATDTLVKAGQHDSASWLKSIRSHNTWKPSDEQIKALRYILQNMSYSLHKQNISDLLEQLKAL